jgi:hypothetical protein
MFTIRYIGKDGLTEEHGEGGLAETHAWLAERGIDEAAVRVVLVTPDPALAVDLVRGSDSVAIEKSDVGDASALLRKG